MANNVVIVLTAKSIGPTDGNNLVPNKVFYLPEEDLEKIEPIATGGCAIFSKNIKAKRVIVRESASELKAAQAGGVTGNVYTDNYYGALTAAGTALSTGTVVTKYLHKVTAATASTADGITLPAPSDRSLAVIINGTSVPVDVFPNTLSAYIDAGASGVAKTLPAFARLHFYTNETGSSAHWKTAVDNGN